MRGVPRRNRWLFLLVFLHPFAVAAAVLNDTAWLQALYGLDLLTTVLASAAALPHRHTAAGPPASTVRHDGFRMVVPWAQRIEPYLHASVALTVAGGLGMTALLAGVFLSTEGIPRDPPSVPGVICMLLAVSMVTVLWHAVLVGAGSVWHLLTMPSGEVALTGRRLSVGTRSLVLSRPTLHREGARLVVRDSGQQLTIEAAEPTLDQLQARLLALPDPGDDDEVPEALRQVARPTRQRE